MEGTAPSWGACFAAGNQMLETLRASAAGVDHRPHEPANILGGESSITGVWSDFPSPPMSDSGIEFPQKGWMRWRIQNSRLPNMVIVVDTHQEEGVLLIEPTFKTMQLELVTFTVSDLATAGFACLQMHATMAREPVRLNHLFVDQNRSSGQSTYRVKELLNSFTPEHREQAKGSSPGLKLSMSEAGARLNPGGEPSNATHWTPGVGIFGRVMLGTLYGLCAGQILLNHQEQFKGRTIKEVIIKYLKYDTDPGVAFEEVVRGFVLHFVFGDLDETQPQPAS